VGGVLVLFCAVVTALDVLFVLVFVFDVSTLVGDSTVTLPSQVPNTLINKTPNQPLRLRLSLAMFSILALALALPLVALPAVPLFVTLASPVVAFTATLLVILAVLVSVNWPVAGLLFAVACPSEPSMALVLPVGAPTIYPSQLPSTFTKTAIASVPTKFSPLVFKVLIFVLALPLVALPALPLLSTVALPLVALVLTLLEISSWLVVEALAIGTLFDGIMSVRLSAGRTILPSRLPYIFMVPTNVLFACTVESRTFTTLAVALALPVVALPAVPLLLTVASPLLASVLILLMIWPFASEFTCRPFGV